MFQELSNDDYFSKNNEFSTRLKEEKNVFFFGSFNGNCTSPVFSICQGLEQPAA